MPALYFQNTLACRVRTFARMRDEMVFAALRCRRPKWEVLLGLLWGRHWREEELFYHADQVGPGRGLAVTACMLLWQQHPGFFALSSPTIHPLKCALFNSFLPAALPPSPPAAAAGGPRGAALLQCQRGAQRRQPLVPRARWRLLPPRALPVSEAHGAGDPQRRLAAHQAAAVPRRVCRGERSDRRGGAAQRAHDGR